MSSASAVMADCG